jgi:hypothetical protein
MSVNEDNESVDSKGNLRDLLDEEVESDNVDDSESELGESDGSSDTSMEDSVQDEVEYDDDYVDDSPVKFRRSSRLKNQPNKNYDEDKPIRVKKPSINKSANAALLYNKLINSQEFKDDPEGVLNNIREQAEESTVASSTNHATTSLPDPSYVPAPTITRETASTASMPELPISVPHYSHYDGLSRDTYGIGEAPIVYDTMPAMEKKLKYTPTPALSSTRTDISTAEKNSKLDSLLLEMKMGNSRIDKSKEVKSSKKVSKKLVDAFDAVSVLSTTTSMADKTKLQSKINNEKENIEAAKLLLNESIKSVTTMSNLIEKAKIVNLQITQLDITNLDGKEMSANDFGKLLNDTIIQMFKTTNIIGEDIVKAVVLNGIDTNAETVKLIKDIAFERALLIKMQDDKMSLSDDAPQSFEIFQMHLEVTLADEKERINDNFDKIRLAVFDDFTTDDGLDLALERVEDTRMKTIEENLDKISRNLKDRYIKKQESFALIAKKHKILDGQIGYSEKYLDHKNKSIDFLGVVNGHIETIINKILPKINKHVAVHDKLNLTAKIGEYEIVTPVLARNLSGIMLNLQKYYKGQDLASFFSDFIKMFESHHPSTITRLTFIDEWFKDCSEKKMWELYTTQSIFKGIMVIIGITDSTEKKLLIKHCQKYFNLMQAAHITNTTDMDLFVKENDTLISHIRTYIANQEAVEKMNFNSKSDGHKGSKDALKDKIDNMSANKLKQIWQQVNTDGDGSTKTPQSNGNQSNTNNNNNNQQKNKVSKMSESQVIAHMASGTFVDKDKGLTMYPIKRTNMTAPLFATIKEANLERDITPADNIFTREKEQTYPYESYKDSANLPRGKEHFSGGSKCKRCKGYGHFYQRCLQKEV